MSDTPPPHFYGSAGPDPDRPEEHPKAQPQPAHSPYGAAEPPRPHDTRPLPPMYGAGPGAGPAAGPGPHGAPPPREPGRTRRTAPLVAGVLAGSLLLGGLAGLGGAAAHEEWFSDDEAATTRNGAVTAPVIDQGSPEAGSGSVEAVAAQVLPAVVRIDVAGGGEAGSGSGIVLTEDGQILTNEHVVSAATDGGSITVSFADGTRTEAEVLGADPLTDTAVIQAQDVSDRPTATIGQSDNLRVGQSVVAIGSPFGLDATVTSGIVSALDRPVNVRSDQAGNSTTYPAIQTDAAINPGNSGGPLVDLTGSVVGINSSIRSSSSGLGGQAGSIGLGFAIPIDEIMPIVEQMAAGETPTHARMGVSVGDATDGQGPASMGALVSEVVPRSSADVAGLEEGDVITRVDDEMIDGSDDLVATVRTYRPGDEVEVTYVRDGEEQTATLVLDSDQD
ncbi:S1C family serine protease [Nocardioides solisilvae]|uniref:S1C family serine protease n=1 Tax=Nocardioides solisilvae TaxID=1542435 RepID=UPI001EF726AE|nr:trypsin-like peptidase domain-containing protein [Nocardioides solisilvae]